MKILNNTTIQERVEQLASALPPIPKNEDTYRVTSEMYGEAEDSNSYNSSFCYCGEWIAPCFEEDFKACYIETIETFQVLRFYYLRMKLQGLAWNEIPENWDDEDAPDFPEPEITHCEEYRQVWIDQQGNEYPYYVEAPFNEWREAKEKTHVVSVASLQPWAYEPRHAEHIKSLVNEITDGCFDTPEDILTWELSQAKEYISKYIPQIASIVNRDFAQKYLRTLQIANRHHFSFPETYAEFGIYADYIRLLDKCDFDILNPRYICPVDIHEAHQRQLAIADRMKAELDRIEAERKEKDFAKNHSYLFNIHFDNGHFRFKSLDSVEEYRQEGINMHHCIYRMAWYDKHDVLSMHISDMEGNRVATCSINVKEQRIVEIQTLCNDREWREGNEYKEIYNVLMARMHTFPRHQPQEKPQKQLKIA